MDRQMDTSAQIQYVDKDICTDRHTHI